MKLIRLILSRLDTLLHSRSMDREMEEELQLHLELETRRNKEAGMGAREAYYAARRSFGGLEQIKEHEREARGWRWLDVLVRDFQIAVRQFQKSPGVTAVSVLSLAIGIGSATIIFSWIQNVILHPLPGVEEQDRVVALVRIQDKAVTHTINLPTVKEMGELGDVFSGVIGSQITPACATYHGSPLWLYGQVATTNFFEVLGVKPVMGRTFNPGNDDTPGQSPVVVLSETCWRRKFNADPDILGRSLTINRQPFTVIGITPGEFMGTMTGVQSDFWIPVDMCQVILHSGDLHNRWGGWLHTQARLRPGVTVQEAQNAVDLRMSQLALAYPGPHRGVETRVVPLWKSPYGAQALMIPVLSVLFTLCLLVLLIVIANVANMQLARSLSRRKEIAVRIATGATRGNIVRQMLTESMLLALMGLLAGLLLTIWGVDLIHLFFPMTTIPIAELDAMHGGTLLFSCLLTLATGIAIGIVPTLHAFMTSPYEVLKENGRSASDSTHQRKLRNAFVVAEIAFALILAICAGLCVRGSVMARKTDIALDPRNTLVAEVNPLMSGYGEAEARTFYRELLEGLRARGQVENASLASWLPLGFAGAKGSGFQVPGYVPPEGEDMTADYAIVSPGYFDTLRIPRISGRDFSEGDADQEEPFIIINEMMARRYWPGEDPLGRTIRTFNTDYTVIGVVKTGKYHYLNEPPRPFIYVNYLQEKKPFEDLQLLVRTRGAPLAFIPSLRVQIRRLDAGMDIRATLPMTEYVESAYFTQRMAQGLLIALGIIAWGLAAIGIFAVMAYNVSQRTREIGIRVAMGAVPGDVVSLILGGGLRLALAGSLLGIIGAALLAHLLTGFLYGISPLSPAVYLASLAAILMATLLACWLPARKATRIQPYIALHTE